jgi:hypothetical protein
MLIHATIGAAIHLTPMIAAFISACLQTGGTALFIGFFMIEINQFMVAHNELILSFVVCAFCNLVLDCIT